MKIFKKITTLLKLLKKDVIVLLFVLKNPDTPLVAKLIALLTVAYALSPVDLIPDFIPLLGYLDDLIIVPILIWITIKLVPAYVMKQSQLQALEWLSAKQRIASSHLRLLGIFAIWCVIIWIFIKHFFKFESA